MKRIFGVLLTMLFVGAFLAFLAAHTIRDHLLGAQTYTSTFAEQRAYERIYDALLTLSDRDPAVKPLLGGVQIAPADAAAALRLVLPPAYVQSEVEGAIEALLAYLRGDASDPAITIHFAPVIDNIPRAATTVLRQQLDHVEVVPVTSASEFSAGLESALASLRTGKPPARLPSIAALPPAQQQAYAALILRAGAASPNPANAALQASVANALAAGDARAAIGLALDGIIQPLAANAVVNLRKQLGPGDTLDLVQRTADHNGQTRQQVLERAAPLRNVTAGVSTWGYWGTLAFAIVIAGSLSVLFAPDRAAMARWPGVALGIAGAVGLALYVVLHSVLRAAASRVDAGSLGAGPSALQSLATDVIRALIRGGADALWLPSSVALVAGVLLIVASRMLRARDGAWAPARDAVDDLVASR